LKIDLKMLKKLRMPFHSWPDLVPRKMLIEFSRTDISTLVTERLEEDVIESAKVLLSFIAMRMLSLLRLSGTFQVLKHLMFIDLILDNWHQEDTWEDLLSGPREPSELWTAFLVVTELQEEKLELKREDINYKDPS
jgi:hypothetical protein